MSDPVSKVKFSHDIAEQEQARRSYTAGQHYVVVTAADRQMSKEKPEYEGVQYKMIKLTLKPLRDPEDATSVVGRGINVYQCLPFWDDEWDGLDYSVQTKDGEMTVQQMLKRNLGIFMDSTREQLAALCPDEVPGRPVKQADGSYIYNGEVIDSESYKESNTESKAAAGELAERLWNEGPEELVGKGCFIMVSYNEGSDFPEVKRYSETQMVDYKTGEVIEVVENIMSARGEATEETEEEAPRASKKNGAVGKPKASKATVAAASKSKSKPTSRARR